MSMFPAESRGLEQTVNKETRRAGQEARLNRKTTRRSKQDAHRNSSQDLKGVLVGIFLEVFSVSCIRHIFARYPT